MTNASEMHRLYLELADLSNSGTSGGGGSGKSKSRPPISAAALDLRVEYEETMEGSSQSYVAVALSGSRFALWAETWVRAAKQLTGEYRPPQPLYGASCLECRASWVEGRKPAVVYYPDSREVGCRSCGWSGELPDL